MRLCPGNEAVKHAKTLLEVIKDIHPDMEDQITQDDIDIDEVLKNQRTMMEGIVTLSKMVNAMHDEIRRIASAKGEGQSVSTNSGDKKETGSEGNRQ
jgi:hypothetical protein